MAEPLSDQMVEAIRTFSFLLGNGSLDPILDEIKPDYRQQIMEYGSDLEIVYTIFLRNLRVDDNGKVLNQGHGYYRAAQWIRSYCDPAYIIEPPLSADEVNLG